MGMQKEVYVGAFLVVEADKIIEKEEKRVCGDHLNWKVLDKDEYCSICGRKLVWKMIENDPCMPNLYDLLPEEEYEDVLLQLDDLDDEESGRIIVIGNLRTDLKAPDCIEINEVGDFVIRSNMSALYIENFEKMYADVIDVLRKRTKLVEINFGVLVYYS